MKSKIKTLLPGIIVILFCIAVWAIIAGTTPSSAAANGIEKLTTSTATGKTMLIAPREPFFFGLNRITWLRFSVFGEMGQPAWEILASLLYIALAFYISKFLDLFINSRLKKWVERTETKLDDLLLDFLHAPTTLLAFVILLHYGLFLSDFLSIGLKVLVAFSLSYFAVRCVDLLMLYWRQRSASRGVDKSFDEMLIPVISKSLKAFVIIVAILLTSDNLGLNIKSVLASLSIGGLALGLAAQDTLANIFGAVSVFIDRPFRIGDRIKLDTVDGTVETIGLRSTRVRSLDGFLVTIPNKTMNNAVITNVTRRPTIKTEINIGLTYDTSVDGMKLALSIISDVYKKHPQTADAAIVFNNFADSSLNVLVIHFCKAPTYADYLVALQEMNLEVKKRLDEAHIDFAFPSRTIYLKQEKSVG
jgi:MscS family membrane protein